MSNVFFWSDLHWGHKLIARIRGFGEHADSTANHDDYLIKAWNKTVQKDDIVWVLGDLTVSNGQIDRMLGIMDRLPGRKRLVFGNHDPAHPMHRDAHKFQKRYMDVFESAQAFGKIKVEGKYVLLSHFPYTLDHTHDARYEQWRLKDEGEFLLHGHTHATTRVSSARELHVGVDAWRDGPVPLNVVERFVREGVTD